MLFCHKDMLTFQGPPGGSATEDRATASLSRLQDSGGKLGWPPAKTWH